MMIRVGSASAVARLAPAHTMASRRFSALLSLEEEYPGTPSTSPASLPAPAIKVSTLPNGAKVVSRSTGDKAASVGLMVSSGSRDEGVGQSGASLLLQGMAFKSTTERSGLKLNRDMELAGVTVSAYGGREQTMYTADCLPETAEAAIAALAETAISAKLSPWEVKASQEKLDAVDLRRHGSDAGSLLEECLHQAAFGEGSPLGRPLLGPCKLSAGGLSDFQKSRFVAPAMAVIGVGVSHESLVGYTESALAAGSTELPADRVPCSFVGEEVRLPAESELTSVALAFPAAAAGDKDAAVFEILAALLDTRAKASVPGSAAGFGASYSDAGMVGICGAAPTDGVAALVAGLAACAKGLAAAGPSDAELASAVISATVKRHLAMENPKNALTSLAEAVSKGVDPAAGSTALEGVTMEAVKAAAAKALGVAPAVAAVGDVAQVPRQADIVKMLA